MQNSAEWMTSAEVAAYLRIGERTLYELVRRQRIPCSRAAGKLLFPRHLVDLWLEGQVEVAGRPVGTAQLAGEEDRRLVVDRWWGFRHGSSLPGRAGFRDSLRGTGIPIPGPCYRSGITIPTLCDARFS